MSKKKKPYFPQKPQTLEQQTKSLVKSLNSYILLNPAYDISVLLKLIGDKAMTQMIIKGTPEEFEDTPNQIFRIVNEPPDQRISL